MTPFALAFAAEYKGFMKANNITGAQIAELLGRGEGYVSERVNGKRAIDTNDVDALASLVQGWDGLALMIELSRRAESARAPRGEVIEGRFPKHDVPAPEQTPLPRVAKKKSRDRGGDEGQG
ncbi:hypothetical protein [Microbacterium maritypicum]